MSEHDNEHTEQLDLAEDTATEVEATQPESTEPESTGPESTEPESTEPESDPETTVVAAAPKPPSGWHPVNIGHLVMGVAFAGLFTVWALVSSDTVDLVDAHWLLPLPWLVAGVVGLVATVLRSATRRPGKMSGWT